MTKLEQHPIAKNLTPPLTAQEMEAYEKNVLQNGQIDDIVMYEGKILDKWHMYQILVKNNIEPKFTDFHLNGVKSPHDFVIAKLHGRHLTRGQTIAIAAIWALNNKQNPLDNCVDANRRKREGTLGNQEKTDWRVGMRFRRTTYLAHNVFMVGENSIGKCIVIKQYSPKVFDRIWRGEITVECGYKEYRISHPSPRRGNYKWALNNIETSRVEIKLPDCFCSNEEFKIFKRSMCQKGWMLEMRERWDDKRNTMEYNANWYGNGFNSMCTTWATMTTDSDEKRAIIVAARDRLASMSRVEQVLANKTERLATKK